MSAVDPGEQVFRAIASPHRRRILDLLATGPKSTSEIAQGLGELTRYAAMQHLAVLEAVGLVVSRKQGRVRVNHLNAVPLAEAVGRWIGSLAATQADGLVGLKALIERVEE